VNTNALIIVLSAATLLSACGPKKDDQTLRSLEDDAVNIVIEKDVDVSHAREKAIAIYKGFEKNDSDPGLRLEARRRLADLELEKSEEVFLNELDKQAAGAGRGADPDLAKQKSYRSAIALYEDLLKGSGPTNANPQVVYQLSKAYDSVGEQQKALKLLKRLVKYHSDVPYIGEVQFRLGELSFLLKKYKDAEKAYAAVLTMGEFSLFYEKALYKHGWALFKQAKYQQALRSYFKLLDRKLIKKETLVEGVQLVDETGLSRISQMNLSGGDLELVKDTFRVVNISLGYLEGANTISEYFNKYGRRTYEDIVYEQLGDYYFRTERIGDSANTYLKFSKIHSSHVRAPLFHLKTIDVYRKGGFAEELFKAKKEFVEIYAFNKHGSWRKHASISKIVTPQLKNNMEEVGRHYHAQAQKSQNPVHYENAITWYKAYIKTFPKDNQSSMINFLLAEALSESDRHEEAVKEYEKTAYRYRKFEKGAEAGYAALLSYSEHEKRLQGKEKEVWRSLSVGSAMRFGKVYPADPRAPKVLIKVAEDLFSLKKYSAASKAAREVLELKSDVPMENRISAWLIIAHTSFDKQDYKGAEISYKIALELTPRNNRRRQELVDGLAASVYKQGEMLRKQGNATAAIAHFARVSDIAPGSEIVVTATYDVASSHMEAKNWNAAVAALKGFRNNYPNHELASNATANLVSAHMNMDQPLLAAAELEMLAQYKDDPDTKRQISLKIIDLYEKADATDKMNAAYKHHIALYPNPFEEAVEMRQKLANLYESGGDTAKQNYWLREIIKANKNAGNQRTDRTQFLAAKASYILALPVYAQYQDVRLVEPLKENMKKKKKVMKEALRVFQASAGYGVAEVATASTFHVAEIYNQFATELMESERPGGLSEEELEQYDILLEDQAYPFEEKAIEIHETNSGRVAEGIYDVWVRKSFAALITLLPVRYAKVERGEAYIDVVR
jgi:tetratricopeptide (TPR) repeat protein